MRRREFLAGGALALPAVRSRSGGAQAAARLPVEGRYYDVEAPETLDLAERARLGLGYFDAITDEKLHYEMYFGGDFDRNRPATMYPHLTALGACQLKALEAIAFERLMCGSTANLDREARMVDMLLSMQGDDGLLWITPDLVRKPWLKIGEPFVMVHGQGRFLRAMIAWYQYTGDPAWKGRIDRLVEGIEKLVVRRQDYAYIPVHGYHDEEYLRSCYTRRGWKDTVEPKDEKFGEEGSLFNHQGHIPGALATWAAMTGNERALRLSGELVRFYVKPQFWADWRGGDYPLVHAAEHAHWQGHFHGYVNTLRAILDYAVVVNDQRLREFARDGYEWSRQVGFARIGYFDHQGCATGRLIGLAVKLSYHGVGDYWEDVDQYIRNHGSEMQFVPEDKPYLFGLSDGKPPAEPSAVLVTDRVVERAIGGFSGQADKTAFFLCCSPHGNMGLFYAWDGTLRHDDGTVRINLLLNRASPWMDVDSHLPYQGKVVLRNKSAREAFVRVPIGVERSAVKCAVGSSAIPVRWFGSYLRVSALRPGDVVTVTFPLKETVERWTIPGIPRIKGGTMPTGMHTCRFKGNTLVAISPPLIAGSPLFQNRVRYLASEAPRVRVTRFETARVLRW
jgi:hypothetical protein